jgi:hypothetical protein
VILPPFFFIHATFFHFVTLQITGRKRTANRENPPSEQNTQSPPTEGVHDGQEQENIFDRDGPEKVRCFALCVMLFASHLFWCLCFQEQGKAHPTSNSKENQKTRQWKTTEYIGGLLSCVSTFVLCVWLPLEMCMCSSSCACLRLLCVRVFPHCSALSVCIALFVCTFTQLYFKYFTTFPICASLSLLGELSVKSSVNCRSTVGQILGQLSVKSSVNCRPNPRSTVGQILGQLSVKSSVNCRSNPRSTPVRHGKVRVELFGCSFKCNATAR